MVLVFLVLNDLVCHIIYNVEYQIIKFQRSSRGSWIQIAKCTEMKFVKDISAILRWLVYRMGDWTTAYPWQRWYIIPTMPFFSKRRERKLTHIHMDVSIVCHGINHFCSLQCSSHLSFLVFLQLTICLFVCLPIKSRTPGRFWIRQKLCRMAIARAENMQ